MQRDLTARLGTLGATLVRFLFGFPFALLFLAALLAVTGDGLPTFNSAFVLWTLLGASTQIGATALMLKTMEQRSFVVTVAYLKTEPLLVALMGLAVLGDPLTIAMALAILLAMAGVMLISVKPQALAGGPASLFQAPALLGLSSAALFAASAIGYRGAILALHQDSFVLAATFTLAVGLTMQTGLLLAWLLAFRRQTLFAIARLWKPSLLAGFT
ncbi:MAG: EamA/RhaT family transporter, partial [Rubrivivax sp.]